MSHVSLRPRFRRDDGSLFPDWKSETLGEITQWTSGGTPPKSNPDLWNGDIPWVSANAMHAPIIYDAPLKVSENAIGAGTRIARSGSILLLVRGMMLRKRIPVCYVARDVAFNQDVKCLTAKGGANSKFIFYWLNAHEGALMSLVSGTNVGTGKLDTEQLQALEVCLPDPQEQARIAAALAAVDRKIALLTEQRAAAEAFKAGTMDRIFRRDLRFKRDDGSAYPEWRLVRFGEAFEWAPTNSLSREMLSDDGGTIQNIHYGDIHRRLRTIFHQNKHHVSYISARTPYSPREVEFCRVGDLVIADASEDLADIGKSIEIAWTAPKTLVAGLHTLLARPKPKSIQPGFAGYMIASAAVRRQIRRLAQGVSVFGISKSGMSNLEIELPCIEEQAKIAAALAAVDARVDAIATQIATMRTFRDGLLRRLFP